MKSFQKIRIALFLIAPSILCISLINKSDAGDPRIDKIMQQVNKFSAQYAQQKVYIHTDKDVYQTGEAMWIKAYLMDATSFQADTVSKEIIVELLDQSQRVACSLILRNKKGVSEGNIFVRDTLIEGNYQLRAYTSWMRNFDRDYFFFKNIKIKNPGYENVVTKSRLKNIIDFNNAVKKKENDYRMTFFPEGGNLVNGLLARVAFKAETALGAPLEIKGMVVDSKGTSVVSFESIHDGMGSFKFLPQPDNKYVAKVTFPNGKTDEYPLPQASPKGIIMSVDPLGKDDIKVVIKPNGLAADNSAPVKILIVAQSRGQINYISKGELKDKSVMSSIARKLLPPGITQITIFDGQGEPVCERLVFNYPEPGKNVSKVDLTTTNKNDSVIYSIKVTPSNGNLLTGNLSLSVAENLSNSGSTGNENILTNLLLTSDIKGRVINPSYYFDNANTNAASHLDLIMLTNGWRRFVWKDLLDGKFPEITYGRVGGISISGDVFGDFVTQPLANNKVILSVINKFDFKFETRTDFKGRFEFPALDYEDTVDIKIEATKTPEGKSGHIALSEMPAPNKGTNPLPVLYSENYDKDKLKENTKRDNIERKKQPKIKKDEEDESQKGFYGSPSCELKIGEDANNYSNVIQYMQGRVPGVEIIGNKIEIRGPKTLMGSTDPLLILDGAQIDLNTLSSLSPLNLEKIDVLKGQETSMFGSRGANGVLVFFSKRGNIVKRSSIELKLTGYHKTREFYTPPYELWTVKPESIGVPKTLFWKPGISLNSKGEAEVRFRKKFSTDKISITLEGLTDSGEIIYRRLQN